MSKSSRFCVVFDPADERSRGKRKSPVYVFRGPSPLPDCLLDKCKPNLRRQIDSGKGQFIFGQENEINLAEREFGDNVHRVDWKGASNSGSLGNFIKEHVANYLFARVTIGPTT